MFVPCLDVIRSAVDGVAIGFFYLKGVWNTQFFLSGSRNTRGIFGKAKISPGSPAANPLPHRPGNKKTSSATLPFSDWPAINSQACRVFLPPATHIYFRLLPPFANVSVGRLTSQDQAPEAARHAPESSRIVSSPMLTPSRPSGSRSVTLSSDAPRHRPGGIG
jgi:hypothetical protein